MRIRKEDSNTSAYEAWLGFDVPLSQPMHKIYDSVSNSIFVMESDPVTLTAIAELTNGINGLFGKHMKKVTEVCSNCIVVGLLDGSNPNIEQFITPTLMQQVELEGYILNFNKEKEIIAIGAISPKGILYGVFHLLRLIATGSDFPNKYILENPRNKIRMINQWDNVDGSIERGYAGNSIFYTNNEFISDHTRIKDYARLLASVGINSISINNVNVHESETYFITERYIPDIQKLADIFEGYGIKLFLCINFAAPIDIDGLSSADPTLPEVKKWWAEKIDYIYSEIPNFGGFLVKADSEGRPGPFTYGRNHADGANMLGEAFEQYGGIVIWRCFVYNCMQDWRDRATDRARAAYDHFRPLDGHFKDNVVLQVKNGPMDFQVREPVSPLFGAMEHTNLLLEFQITQEYTGQQQHLCYLVPQWKEVLNFETFALGEGSTLNRVVDGTLHGNKIGGMAAVSNIGDSSNWTGHFLAQANLYGYGRLAWNPELSSSKITKEWINLTFGNDSMVNNIIYNMLLNSWSIYESYTSPLGVGWMINPSHHFGPNIDGYEYSKWGTYHFADRDGIGVDRTFESGTGYVSQYMGENINKYGSLDHCPDELLLFFHHVPYTHVLKSNKTVIQHIYDSHFDGVEMVINLLADWDSIKDKIDGQIYEHVRAKMEYQIAHAKEWCDIINTYFYRKSGISDIYGRKIY